MLVERDDRVGVVLMNRPKQLNALSGELMGAVVEALVQLDGDDEVRAIVLGGGNELQMACDLAVMADDAFIRHVGPEHGSVPAGGATQWLPVFVGDRRAREIIYMCEQISPAQAAEWGLINWAVPAAELDAKVDEVVEKLAAKLPQTTRYAKQQLNFWRDLSWHETVNHARDWLALSMLGDEAQEAVKAFLRREGPDRRQ